jgi:hypothetical protein
MNCKRYHALRELCATTESRATPQQTTSLRAFLSRRHEHTRFRHTRPDDANAWCARPPIPLELAALTLHSQLPKRFGRAPGAFPVPAAESEGSGTGRSRSRCSGCLSRLRRSKPSSGVRITVGWADSEWVIASTARSSRSGSSSRSGRSGRTACDEHTTQALTKPFLARLPETF